MSKKPTKTHPEHAETPAHHEEKHSAPKPVPPSESETLTIGESSYTVLERLPKHILHLRYAYPDAPNQTKDFYYEEILEKRMEKLEDGSFVPGKGVIPGFKFGPRKKKTEEDASADDEFLKLSAKAQVVVDDFVRLSGGGNRDDIVSKLVVEHLTKEVERLRNAQSFARKLGNETLAELADLDPEELKRLLAAVKKN